MTGYGASLFVFVKREAQREGYSITRYNSRVIPFRTLPLAHILSSVELLYMSLQITQLVWSDPEQFLVNILHLQADGFAC